MRSQKTVKRFAIAGAGLLVIGVLLWFGRQLAGETLERYDQLASVVSMFAGVASLAIVAVQLRKKPESHAVDEAEQLARAAETLADAVQVQWEQEARMRGLRRPTPLRLHWLTTDRPVTAPATTIVGNTVGDRQVTRIRFYGHLDEVGEKFLALPHRRLVVLGEPGAGKTVLATLLTLDLLGRRRPGDAVPVQLTVSAWNPMEESLYGWIARRLDESYPALGNAATYGPNASQQLVISGRILPILDGLDEMPTGLRAIAIGDLNQAHGGRPLVLTCRSEEFEEAMAASGEVWTAAAVVEIQSVTVEEAISYLQAVIPSTDTRWDQVFSILRAHPNDTLAATLSSPLMVALARTIYTSPDREPRELVAIASSGDRATVESHLLEDFIPAVYKDQRGMDSYGLAGHQRWDARSARRNLAFLAMQLRLRRTRELAWWEMYLAVPQRTFRLLIGLMSGILTALGVGAMLGLSAGSKGSGL